MKFQQHRAVIFSVSGEKLLDEERSFFAKAKPLGFILFARNIKDKAQVKALVQDLRDSVDNQAAPIFLDQEGGRVARLKEPIWYHPFSASVFGRVAAKSLELAKEACFINAQLIAHEMLELSINVDCAPVADILQEYSSNVIGDRAFGSDKNIVAELADSMAKGLLEGGVQPVIKHIPGHGRAKLDSHLALPEVYDPYKELKDHDFYPFKKLNKYKMAMTAHVLYDAIDRDKQATLSKDVIREIRDTIGFKGLLVSDCITMKALEGSMADRAAGAFEAGCDIVIYSNAKLSDMKEIIKVSPEVTAQQEKTLIASYKMAKNNPKPDIKKLKSRLLEILENNVDKQYLLFSTFDPTEQLQ